MAGRSSHLRSLKPQESALWISLPFHHLVKLPTPELSTDYGAPLFQLSIIDNLRFHFLLASILGPTESNRVCPIRKIYNQSTRMNSHFWFTFCLVQLLTTLLYHQLTSLRLTVIGDSFFIDKTGGASMWPIIPMYCCSSALVEDYFHALHIHSRYALTFTLQENREVWPAAMLIINNIGTFFCCVKEGK
jgi:hypothetical protein